MTLELTRHCFTISDYDRMIEAGILDEDDRVELIEGEIIEMTPIGHRHAACVKRLNLLLGRTLGADATIGVQDPIQLGDRSEPQPDISALRPSPNFYASAHPTTEDIFLLIEVAESSATLNRQVKVPLYARHAVAEVWLVDLDDNSVTVYRDPTPTGYISVRVTRRGETPTMQAFPRREIAVSDIL
jgi:Uma2 family endonuclease